MSSMRSYLWAPMLVLAACGRQEAPGTTVDAGPTVDAATPRDAGPSLDAATPGGPGDGSAPEGPGPTLTTGHLKLISYNVQARPVLDDARAAINLPIIGAMFGEFGVADVQECFSQCDKLLAAAPQPNKYYFDQRQNFFSLANSGLAGLSWYPIEQVVTVNYQAKAELADTVASKGVALIRLNIDGFAVDVYNTHMQAGDSDGAHVAQSAQADELIAFIATHSPSERTVILHGDFNMGPARPGKPLADFTPNHYSNEADMLARTANFQKLVDQLGLSDVSDVLFGPVRDHIERVLYRPGQGVKVRPLSWEDRTATFLDPQGAPLSDSMPMVVELALERGG